MFVFLRFLGVVLSNLTLFDFSKVAYGIEEGHFLVDHDEVDGIEVLFAAEAAREVCTWIGRGIEF